MMIFDVKILFLSACVLLSLPNEYNCLEDDGTSLWVGGMKRSAISKLRWYSINHCLTK